MNDLKTLNLINKLLMKHKVPGTAYLDNKGNFFIDYEGKMRNSGAFRFLNDLFYHSDLVTKQQLKMINEFSKRYAVSNKDKVNGMITIQ